MFTRSKTALVSVREECLNSREKFEPQISCLALYHLSYPGSIDSTGLNLPLESNAIQVFWSVTLSVMI